MNNAIRRFPLPLIIVPAAILTAAVFILIICEGIFFSAHAVLKVLYGLDSSSSVGTNTIAISNFLSSDKDLTSFL